MMVQCIFRHRYHLHTRIVTSVEQYNFSSYQFHKHLTIYVIMVVSCMLIRYTDYPRSQRKRSGGLVDSFDVRRINVRGINLSIYLVYRFPFDHIKITEMTILRNIMNEYQTLAS